MTSHPHNFLGLPKEYSDYKSAKYCVLPVPYEKTVSYKRGTVKGPSAIIDASAQVELYDEELGREHYQAGIATLNGLQVAGLPTKEMFGAVCAAASNILADGKIPIVLGGEHSITPPVVKAVCEFHKDVTVVQFDAHADLRQEYEGDPMSHASALARVRDFCPAVQLGIRNLSAEEAMWMKKDNLPVFFAHDMRGHERWIEEAIARISTEKVYVTFDVDGFDSSLMPATGTPEPGGLSWYDVTGFLRKLAARKKIVGFDLVELAPSPALHACDFTVAKLAYKMIGYSSAV